MIYKIKNKTRQKQEVHFWNGESKVVQPKEEIDLDADTIYREEFERIKVFFEIDKAPVDPSLANRKVSFFEKKGPGIVVKQLNTDYGGK